MNSQAFKSPLHRSGFRYYIHDSAAECRLQLIGEMKEEDLPELVGCWETARSILGHRKLIVDLYGLRQLDEACERWLHSMAAEGAILQPAVSRNGLEPEPSPRRSGLIERLNSYLRVIRVTFD